MPLKIAIVGICIFVLYKLFRGDLKKKQNETSQEKFENVEDMVKDPICGAFVDKNATIRVKTDTETVCFCSYDCRDAYIKSLEEEKKS